MGNEKDWLEQNIQTYQQAYFFIKLNQKNYENPLTKMLNEVWAFADCFDNSEKHLKELRKIYLTPIEFILKKYPFLYSTRKKKRMRIYKTLPEVEWMYYRYSKKQTPLKRKFFVDEFKPSNTRYLAFGDITGLRGHIEKEISRVFNEVVKENRVSLDDSFNFMNKFNSEIGGEDKIDFGKQD